ncbi:MAG TPA: hypothetical protein VF832_18665 [Longimicrobiales bacterium]
MVAGSRILMTAGRRGPGRTGSPTGPVRTGEPGRRMFAAGRSTGAGSRRGAWLRVAGGSAAPRRAWL